MASAEKTTVETTKVIVTEGITLTLDKDEVDVLNVILDRIGGDPAKSRRRITEGIVQALVDAGVRDISEDYPAEDVDPSKRAIYFLSEA